MNFQISKASEADLKAILELQKECYKTEAELHKEYSIPPLTQTFESINEDFKQGTLFLKGIVDGQLVASVRGQIKEGSAYIGRLIVKPEFQNNKFGQTLMKEIESQFENCNRYELFTGFKSEKNLNFYQKLGYKEFKIQFINDNLTLVYLEKLY
ncbi:GNAT family N-acetyltransferase [Flavobacterium ajazii]|uniref:GNAT family N-acetyltransferase n=1 Tax=Flavobacterium ajazii TaxID=2692318 RepID=UPI0013D7207B|nr:GNAT family N-acetyltransferase [Flavobacterium ajazii]